MMVNFFTDTSLNDRYKLDSILSYQPIQIYLINLLRILNKTTRANFNKIIKEILAIIEFLTQVFRDFRNFRDSILRPTKSYVFFFF